MRLRPLFSYFGSKWRLAPRYPAPAHASIVEPFAGSAGYALHYPDLEVTLVDLDPVICGVWSYLIGASRSDLLALPLIEPGQSTDDLACCQEARWLIGFWVSSAAERPRKRLTSWGLRYASQFWCDGIRARIAHSVERIRHWRVIHGPFATAPAARATFFVDPPYVGKSRVAKITGGGIASMRPVGDRYRFGTRRVDYGELATWCRTRRGQVIACESLGATWLPFSHLVSAHAACPGHRSEEAIWTNAREQLGLALEAS